MRRPAALLLGCALALSATLAEAQLRGLQPPQPPPVPAPPHRAGELECKNCHEASHRGILQMYLGMGGRGTPMIPSHMVQVRVECVACHVSPRPTGVGPEGAGRTFRPSEEACLGCHGEKYRGMLERWASTLARMQGALATKLVGARTALAAADPKGPKLARARQLVDDAAFNVQFTLFGKGVHNVFYAADLLKLANGWLDEAVALLGKPPVRIDDALVRGGYCAVLCHEQAGVKQRETVTFRQQTLPHVRHVTELGATCTACHSAEVHKAVTATPATCASCHHGPQNERCESCHRAQSAFYRGQVQTDLVTVEPSVMVDVVPCTGCHDFTARHSRQAVAEKCAGCHDAPYLALHSEWTTGFDRDASRAAAALRRAEAALASARRAGRKADGVDTLLRDARTALALVRKARGAHNPAVADALLGTARQKAEAALAQLGRR